VPFTGEDSDGARHSPYLQPNGTFSEILSIDRSRA
jgi:hypothetical protein